MLFLLLLLFLVMNELRHMNSAKVKLGLFLKLLVDVLLLNLLCCLLLIIINMMISNGLVLVNVNLLQLLIIINCLDLLFFTINKLMI